jgi:hypothetical protein
MERKIAHELMGDAKEVVAVGWTHHDKESCWELQEEHKHFLCSDVCHEVCAKKKACREFERYAYKDSYREQARKQFAACRRVRALRAFILEEL